MQINNNKKTEKKKTNINIKYYTPPEFHITLDIVRLSQTNLCINVIESITDI